MTDTPDIAGGGNSHRAAKEELLKFAERIERLKAEKKESAAEFNDQIKDAWAEAKGRGYDKKALDEVLRLRALDEDTRAVVNLYADSLGVFG